MLTEHPTDLKILHIIYHQKRPTSPPRVIMEYVDVATGRVGMSKGWTEEHAVENARLIEAMRKRRAEL